MSSDKFLCLSRVIVLLVSSALFDVAAHLINTRKITKKIKLPEAELTQLALICLRFEYLTL